MAPPTSLQQHLSTLLSLPPSNRTTFTPHAHSSFCSTFKITSTPPPSSSSSSPTTSSSSPPPRTQTFFLKTSTSPTAAPTFQGEHASLLAIHAAEPTLCPRSLFTGADPSNASLHYLVTEFISPPSRSSQSTSTFPSSSTPSKRGKGGTKQRPASLAQKLAKMHSTPAPLAPGAASTTPLYGFPVPTACGATLQPNQPYGADWAAWFAEHRMRFMAREIRKEHGTDRELEGVIEDMARGVCPRLLGAVGGGPVVVHGDLWAGNFMRGRIERRRRSADGGGSEKEMNEDENEGEREAEVEAEGLEEVVEGDIIFDPSACYAHFEYDHGIMRMFGGFDAGFWAEYWACMPEGRRPEREDGGRKGYEDRVELYEAYHQLNHYLMFGGGGYRGGAVRVLTRLVGKYGSS